MKAYELLANSADLLAQGWCQRHIALREDGHSCGPRDPEAVSWCALGAMCHVGGYGAGSNDYEFSKAVYLLETKVIGGNIIPWNNAPERTQAEVVAAFREGANLARLP